MVICNKELGLSHPRLEEVFSGFFSHNELIKINFVNWLSIHDFYCQAKELLNTDLYGFLREDFMTMLKATLDFGRALATVNR